MRRFMRGLEFAVVLSAVLASTACEDRSHREIGDEINIVVRRNDALVPPAMARLAAFGRSAIPQIETALHTAAPTGRLHLIQVLDKIGDEEAIPILRHHGVYDPKPEVRGAAEAVLTRWAADNGAKVATRAERARRAQAEMVAKRKAGEAPLIFGDGGTPGAPSTIGAAQPVGSELEKAR